MQVVIIGSGNVATVLGRLMLQKNHQINQVISANKANAKKLADILHAESSDDLKAINKDADIYIIAVSDQKISVIANELSLQRKLVLHTAASVSANVLQQTSENYGVLWPMQTIRKEIENIPPIPFIVTANNFNAINQLKVFAETLSNQVSIADDITRFKYHIAAVFASNFSNHMFVLAEEYCEREGIDFSQLVPLIVETGQRIKDYSPYEVQTGPAKREDITTIMKHIEILETQPYLKRLYLKLSNSISQMPIKRR